MQKSTLQQWMKSADITHAPKRELPQHAAQLATLFLTESQKHLKGKHKQLREWLCALSKKEELQRFFLAFCRWSASGDQQEKELLLERFAQHRDEILDGLTTMQALRLRLGKYIGRDNFTTLAHILNEAMGSLFQYDEPASFERLYVKRRKQQLAASVRILHPETWGNISVQNYSNRICSLLPLLPSGCLELDVRRLLPQYDCYNWQESVERLRQRLIPILQVNAQRPEPLRIMLCAINNDRLMIVAQLCSQLKDESSWKALDLGMELSACHEASPDVLDQLKIWAKKKKQHRLTLRLLKGEQLPNQRMQAEQQGRGEHISATRLETDVRLRSLMQSMVSCPQLQLELATHHLLDIAYACVLWAHEQKGDKQPPRLVFYAGLGTSLAMALTAMGMDCSLSSFHHSRQQPLLTEEYWEDILHSLKEPYAALSLSPTAKHDEGGWQSMVQHFTTSWNKTEKVLHDIDLEKKAQLAPFRLPVQRSGVAAELQAALLKEKKTPLTCYRASVMGKEVESQFSVRSRIPWDYQQVDYTVEGLNYEQINQVIEQMKLNAQRVEKNLNTRLKVLEKIALTLSSKRAPYVSALVRDAGYRLCDADAEIAQAITLCDSMVQTLRDPSWMEGLQLESGGLAVVNASTQRPFIEGVEGICTAYVLGYASIYKPANTTRRVAEMLHALLLSAGMKKESITIAQCLDNQVAAELFNNEAVDAFFHYAPLTIIEGAQPDRAKLSLLLQQQAAINPLYARQDADMALLLRALTQSFALRSAQLELSPRVLLLHASLYDRAEVLAQIKDAFASLQLGTEFAPRSEALSLEKWTAHTQLREGESWLLPPDEQAPLTPLYRPAVRLGVQADSPLLQAEHGAGVPHLSIVRVNTDQEAMGLQKRISSGSFATLFTQEKQIIAQWKKGIAAQRLFVNCAPTPILLEKKGQSSEVKWIDIAHAGSFLPKLARWKEGARPQSHAKTADHPFKPWELIRPRLNGAKLMRLRSACESIIHAWENEFGITCAKESLAGTVLERRWLTRPVYLRIDKDTTDTDYAIQLFAAYQTGQLVEISLEKARSWAQEFTERAGISVEVESRTAFEKRLKGLEQLKHSVLRDATAPASTKRLASELQLTLANAPVLAQGYIELLQLCEEQICLSAE